MFPSIIRIFVSSTWLDLQPERQAVETAINRMSGAKFVGMEYFGSRPETTERASLDEVDNADLYIGVIGGRFGSGITEAEYRRAFERGLPCFIYFKKESTIAIEWRESDGRLEVFKEKLRARHIITEPFSSPEQLANCVTADLHRWFFDEYLSERLSNAAAGEIATGEEGRRIRLEAGSEYGGVIYRGAEPQIRRRPIPVRPSLRPFRGLLDRADETSAVVVSLESLLPVEFCGQSGIGKTALMRHLAHHIPDVKFPDGAVYLGQVGRRPSCDLLQFIFDSFYESDYAFKPREAEMLNLLRDRRALVLMDDVETGRDEIERVMNATPDSAFVLASEERRLSGEGKMIPLLGLPRDEALQLLERELGRALAPEEQAAAATICSLLQGHPLRLAQTASLAQGQDLTLIKIAEQLQSVEAQSGDLGDSLIKYSLTSLSEGEKRALAAAAALGGALAPAWTLGEIADLADIEATLNALFSRGLIESHEAGFRLTAASQRMVEVLWDLTLWRERALDYFTARAEELQREPQRRRELSAATMSLLDWASRTGRWREAIRLGVAAEAAVVLSGQWEAWGQALEQIGQAAQMIGDSETEAWALHQQGTRSLCLGDDDLGREMLTEAMKRRIEMGDHSAASVTRHNLDWLLPQVFLPQPQPPIYDEPPLDPIRPVPRRFPGLAKFAIALSLLGGFALGGKEAYDYFTIRPAAVIKFDPERLDFGEQELGDTGATRTVTVTNTDNQPLPISNIAIRGVAPGDFRIAENGCAGAKLAPQGGCSVSLVFSPQAAGTRGATLTITAGARRGLPSLPLNGAAMAKTIPSPEVNPVAQIALTPDPVAQIALTPDNLDFSSREVGAREEKTISITNTGNAPLQIRNLTIRGRREFAVTKTNCVNAALGPKGACVVEISFSPQRAGLFNQSLIISDNSQGSPHTVRLTGTGIRRERPKLVVNPNNVAFENQIIGRRGKLRDVTLGAEGDGTLSINNVYLEGDSNGAFRIVSNCASANLKPGAAPCKVEIAFTPRGAGSHSASLVIASNAEGAMRRVPLSGTAVNRPRRDITVSPSNINFNIQEIKGAIASQPIKLGNPAPEAIVINSVALNGGHTSDFRLRANCAFPKTLNPGESCEISADFAPTTIGRREASVEINSDADNNPLRVILSGNGIQRRLPAPSIISFTADRYQVEPRGRVSLCYGVSNATSAAINPEIGQVNSLEKECRFAYPNQTTTYTLTAVNAEGQAQTKSVTVKVSAPPKPAVIGRFEASPNSVNPGGRVELCYSVLNAVSASIGPGIGEVKLSEKNCVQAFPDRTTTFTLSAIGPDGQPVTSRARVTVTRAQRPPIISEFFASRAEIMRGQETELCYGVMNASRVQIEPNPGAVEPSEKNCVRVRPARTLTYTLIVTSYDGRTASAKVTIEVAAEK